jgi:glycosyltransferase involved in cell wall biosynthesis
MSSLRIVHVGTSEVPVLHELGGALQRRIAEMSRIQACDHHDVTVLTPWRADETFHAAGVRFEGIRLRSSRPYRDYEFLMKSAIRLRRSPQFDVLHAHGSPEAARFLGRYAAIKMQSVDFFRYRLTASNIGRAYYTSSLNAFDLILPVSTYCASEFATFYPKSTSRRVVLPNGVNTDQFYPDGNSASIVRNALGLPPGPLVVYLGRVCEQKGSDLLVELAEALDVSHPEVTVVAAGPAEQFSDRGETPLIRALTKGGVLVTGAIHESHLRGLLNSASVFVLPTRRDEMFGMAALEAAACGVPIVASRLGGIPEAVGSGGILFPPGNSNELIVSVRLVISDNQLAMKLGLAAEAHAQKYSWRKVVNMATDIYSEALQ